MDEEVEVQEINYLGVKIGFAVFGFAIGVGVGYLLGKKSKTPVINVIPAREASPVQEQEESPRVSKSGEDFVKTRLLEHISEPEEEPEIIANSIFAATTSDWNFDDEIKNRSQENPYVIHRDEFYAVENDFSQITLTYYAGDNILTDEDEKPIYNAAELVGEMKFGHGTEDPNTFYVRNHRRHAEYEVVRDPGHYVVEVLGLEMEQDDPAELRHSRQPKFKME